MSVRRVLIVSPEAVLDVGDNSVDAFARLASKILDDLAEHVDEGTTLRLTVSTESGTHEMEWKS